jgi:hypothetical protein
MADKFAVRKIRNAVNVLWSSSVITANLKFSLRSPARELSKKRSKNGLLCTILFQDFESKHAVEMTPPAFDLPIKVLIIQCLR